MAARGLASEAGICLRPALRDSARNAPIPATNLKNAAFLAFVVLVTLPLVFGFIGDVLSVARGVVPAMRLAASFIYAFAGFGVVAFLYVFHKARV